MGISKEYLFNLYSKYVVLDYNDMKNKVNYFHDLIKKIEDGIKPEKIQDLDISVRSLNVLKKAKINTVDELLKYRESDLYKFRDLGKKSIIELIKELNKSGLSLRK